MDLSLDTSYSTPINGGDISSPDSGVALGLPPDPNSSLPQPGFETTSAADQPSPVMSTIQSIWGTIKQDSLGAATTVENAVTGEVSNAYNSVTNAATNAVSSVVNKATAAVTGVENKVTGTLTSVYWYAILAVVVIGGVLYFGGKSGALRVGVPV